MATEATTLTESLQCIACSIRQNNQGEPIDVQDLSDFAMMAGDQRLRTRGYADIMDNVEIPNNTERLLGDWYSRQGSPDGPNSGTDLNDWFNSCVWIANKLAKNTLGTGKTYKFFHADNTAFKMISSRIMTDVKDRAVDPKFKQALNLLFRGSGDKWNPADMFAIEKNQVSKVDADLSAFLSTNRRNPTSSVDMYNKNKELESFLKNNGRDIPRDRQKNLELYVEMGDMYDYNTYVDQMFNKKIAIPISLKKAQSASPPSRVFRHKEDKGLKKALNFEVEIEKVDYKFDADKALVYFSVSGHSGHFLDMRGFETSASIENIQIQLMKTGSSAAHGKIALPLYSFITEESGGMPAIRAQRRVKTKLLGRDFSGGDTIFTPATIFDQYANNKAPKSGTRSNQRFNRRTLIEDTTAWAQYIRWLTRGRSTVPSETAVQTDDVVRNVRQRLGDPTDSFLEGSDVDLLPKSKIGKKSVATWQHKEKSPKKRAWEKDAQGKFKKMLPTSRYAGKTKSGYTDPTPGRIVTTSRGRFPGKVGKPQDFIWAAKYIKNKVQSAEAAFVLDITRKVPKKKIKENILKSVYSYAGSKGFRIFSDSGIKEFFSASTYVKIGG